jgi:starvation-inducible DNA-binding protein
MDVPTPRINYLPESKPPAIVTPDFLAWAAIALRSETNNEYHEERQIDMKTSTKNTMDASKMYETENDISPERRSELNALMNQRLADAVDLQMQMKQAHWNVKGPHFIGLHELFDQIDEAVESYVDLIAERIVQLGGIAEGTVRMAAERSRLEEYPLIIADGQAHVEAVSKALSTFGHEARKTIAEADELEDADTADIFTEISRGIDKWLWFVEAHFQATK